MYTDKCKAMAGDWIRPGMYGEDSYFFLKQIHETILEEMEPLCEGIQGPQ